MDGERSASVALLGNPGLAYAEPRLMASSTLLSALALLEVAYVVALGAWILLEKRSPVATLAWLLALVALPGVGFVVYFFLGPRRLRRRRLKRLRASQAALKPDARGRTERGDLTALKKLLASAD